MKRAALAVLLLLTTAAFGQSVSEERVLGPFEPGRRDGSVAVAGSPHGILLAWSEVNPETQFSEVRTTLVDAEGRLTGEIHTLPTTRPNAHATGPLIASDGNTFFVVWVERDPFTYAERLLAGALCDSTGKPIEASRRLGAPRNAILVFTGEYKLHFDGARRVAFATPDANGWIDWTPGYPGHTGSYPFDLYRQKSYRIDWAILTHDWVRTGFYNSPNYSGGAPTVVAEENDLLVVWPTNSGLQALRIDDGKAGESFSLRSNVAAATQPAMAGSLVVFAKDGAVHGSIVSGDAFGEPFPISAGPEPDDQPRILQIGESRYFVAYVRDHGAVSSLAWRIVDIAP